MEQRDIIDLFKKEFENLRCTKEYFNSLTSEEKITLISKIFFNAAENIDEDYSELKETEKDENDRWYNKYFNMITNLYFKYLAR